MNFVLMGALVMTAVNCSNDRDELQSVVSESVNSAETKAKNEPFHDYTDQEKEEVRQSLELGKYTGYILYGGVPHLVLEGRFLTNIDPLRANYFFISTLESPIKTSIKPPFGAVFDYNTYYSISFGDFLPSVTLYPPGSGVSEEFYINFVKDSFTEIESLISESGTTLLYRRL